MLLLLLLMLLLVYMHILYNGGLFVWPVAKLLWFCTVNRVLSFEWTIEMFFRK